MENGVQSIKGKNKSLLFCHIYFFIYVFFYLSG